MRTIRCCSALLSLLGMLSAPHDALAHTVLLESTPRASEAAAEVRGLDLRFNSRLEPAFSRVRLTGPLGHEMAVPAGVSRAELNRLTAALPGLDAGPYTVHWRVLTVDGHLNHGSFWFRIAPPSP